MREIRKFMTLLSHLKPGLIKLSIKEKESVVDFLGSSAVYAVAIVFLDWRLDNDILSNLGLDF